VDGDEHRVSLVSRHVWLGNLYAAWLPAGLSFVVVASVGGVSAWWLGESGAPFLVASIGAATVLIFAAPRSPLSQPWPLVGGHLVCACVGVACYRWIPDPVIACAAALGLGTLLMAALRCTHPPGGAVALGAVLGGDTIHDLGFWFVLMPVALNVALLLGLAILLHRWLPGRQYPAPRSVTPLTPAATAWATGPARYRAEDLRIALAEIGAGADLSAEHLQRIYTLAVMQANKRRLGEVRCRDIMSDDIFTVTPQTAIDQAWTALQQQGLKAAPVVDEHQRVVGMLTVADFLRHAGVNEQGGWTRLRGILRRARGRQAARVSDVMSAPAVTAELNRHIVDLVAVFTEKHIHHLPIVDAHGRLAGVITRSDLMRALSHTRV
jgi:CBS domain-containing membrane protein